MKTFKIFIITLLFLSYLNAGTNSCLLILQDGKAFKIPIERLKDEKSFSTKLLYYDKIKEIPLNQIHRILKIRNKNEAIVYLKNQKSFKIEFFFDMIFKEENPQNNISYKRISEVIFK